MLKRPTIGIVLDEMSRRQTEEFMRFISGMSVKKDSIFIHAARGRIKEQEEAPHLRPLQKRLAKEVTVMVHSQEDYDAAVEASNILFGNSTSEALKHLDEQTLLDVFNGVPQFEVSREELSAGVKAKIGRAHV